MQNDLNINNNKELSKSTLIRQVVFAKWRTMSKKNASLNSLATLVQLQASLPF